MTFAHGNIIIASDTSLENIFCGNYSLQGILKMCLGVKKPTLKWGNCYDFRLFIVCIHFVHSMCSAYELRRRQSGALPRLCRWPQTNTYSEQQCLRVIASTDFVRIILLQGMSWHKMWKQIGTNMHNLSSLLNPLHWNMCHFQLYQQQPWLN